MNVSISITLPDVLNVVPAATTTHVIAAGQAWLDGEQVDATITLVLSSEQMAKIAKSAT